MIADTVAIQGNHTLSSRPNDGVLDSEGGGIRNDATMIGILLGGKIALTS